MDSTTLGRTGLRVSVLGLGCGGHSRLGQSYGRSEQESVEVVRAALDHGVTFFDTAEVYRTESILGAGLRGVPREHVVVSTKTSPVSGEQVVSPAQLSAALDSSLQRLGMEYVDVYLLHGLSVAHYDQAVSELVPALETLRTQGKVRFFGVTEAFASDPGHAMLSRAVQDDCWDVIMVGFNLLNQSARERVLVGAQQKNIGVLNMFAVRRALANPDALSEALLDLGQRGVLDAEAARAALDAVVHESGACSLQDAAYRFCRYEPGIHVVLSGTGSLEHLAENAASLARPPLPPADVTRLKETFGGVDDISGN